MKIIKEVVITCTSCHPEFGGQKKEFYTFEFKPENIEAIKHKYAEISQWDKSGYSYTEIHFNLNPELLEEKKEGDK